MKTVVLGALISAGLVIAATGSGPDRNEAFAQRAASPPVASAAGELIALSTAVGDRYEVLTVIDPKARVLAIYHVDLRSGGVELLSVRKIEWDLQMESFNTKVPLPQEVRSFLEARTK